MNMAGDFDFREVMGDYENIRCSSCISHNIYYGKPLPIQRIFERTDKYIAAREYSEADNIFRYYLSVAENNGDLRGEFTLRNDLIGFFRNLGNFDSALENAERAVIICDEMKAENTVSAASCYVNSAVIFRMKGQEEKALRFFRIAQQIYEFDLEKNDFRLAALRNNLSLSLFDYGDYDEAASLLSSAIANALENRCFSSAALSCINLAAVLSIEDYSSGFPEIKSLISKAGEYLLSETVHNCFYDSVFSKYNKFLDITGV